jgi:hypothetical protein
MQIIFKLFDSFKKKQFYKLNDNTQLLKSGLLVRKPDLRKYLPMAYYKRPAI